MGVPQLQQKIEAQLVIVRDLLEEAGSLGIDLSEFKKRLSSIEKMTTDKSGPSVASFVSDLSEAIEEFKRAEEEEAENQPTLLEAEIYEYLMKHGGMSVSAYSKEHNITQEEARKAVDRLVELHMLEVRKV